MIDMQKREKILAGVLSGTLLMGVSVPALAATVHYNDGSTVLPPRAGGS